MLFDDNAADVTLLNKLLNFIYKLSAFNLDRLPPGAFTHDAFSQSPKLEHTSRRNQLILIDIAGYIIAQVLFGRGHPGRCSIGRASTCALDASWLSSFAWKCRRDRC